MEDDRRSNESEEAGAGAERLLSRRDFLDGLGKWSKIVLGATVFGGALLHAGRETEAYGAGWANRGGGGGGGAWANRGGGGGGGAAWANRGGGGGGGAAWANRAGGGGAAWANRGAAWANRGSAWVNRY